MHWHLNVEEWRVADSQRFSNSEQAVTARRQAREGVAWTPAEVGEWSCAMRRKLIEQYSISDESLQQSGLVTDEQWASREATQVWMAELGLDVYGLLALPRGRIAHLYASVVHVAGCHERGPA